MKVKVIESLLEGMAMGFDPYSSSAEEEAPLFVSLIAAGKLKWRTTVHLQLLA